MRGKLSLLIGLGAGYVLGTRSGRERYDQMADKARQMWRDPRVQEKASKAQHAAQEKAGQAGHAVQEKAGQAGHAVKDKISSNDSPSGGSSTSSSSGSSPTGSHSGSPSTPGGDPIGGTGDQARPTGPGTGTS